MNESEKQQMLKAKAYIQKGRYVEAQHILNAIDHPKAREWLYKIEAKLGRSGSSKSRKTPTTHKPQLGQTRFWRNFWGILTLLSIGWLCYGITMTSSAANTVLEETEYTTEAEQVGTELGVAIGGSVSLALFLCTGGPLFVLFLILYWRNGVAIRQKREHAEMMTAMANSQR